MRTVRKSSIHREIFLQNELKILNIIKNAESIYYLRDSKNELVGIDKSKSASIKIFIDQNRIEEIRKINQIIPNRGIYRYDFLLHENELYINEINTIPGSHALYLWKNLNSSKFELLDSMIDEALSRQVDNWALTGSDGIALKSAKDIASKLG